MNHICQTIEFLVKNLKILWKFSRPHTIIGTIVSVTSLFIISNQIQGIGYLQNWGVLFVTLMSCLGCNLYITGLNQIYDVELDKINKPNLPIASGELSTADAKKIAIVSLSIALFFAYIQNLYFGGLITSIAIIGSFYSIPPVRLKKYHFWAATAIAIVRGPLVNLGIYIHFYYTSHGLPITLNSEIILLTFIITAFSIGIAWFKDIPDYEGDKKFNINTLTVKLSKKKTLQLGLILVSSAYLISIIYAFYPEFIGLNLSPDPINDPSIKIAFGIFQTICLIIICISGLTLNTENQTSVKRFYMLYWVMFFFEYLGFVFLY